MQSACETIWNSDIHSAHSVITAGLSNRDELPTFCRFKVICDVMMRHNKLRQQMMSSSLEDVNYTTTRSITALVDVINYMQK